MDIEAVLEFAEGMTDGSIAEKYMDIDGDALARMHTIAGHIMSDFKSAAETVRQAGALGGGTVCERALEYLTGALPELADDMLSLAGVALDAYQYAGDAEFGSLGIGGFIREAAGALTPDDFGAEGRAPAYLEGVSGALGEALRAFEEVAALVGYDKEYCAAGLGSDGILEELGLDNMRLTALFDEILCGAAARLTEMFDGAGADAKFIECGTRAITREIAASADNIAKLRAAAEELFAVLGEMCGAAEGYMAEREMRDEIGDILCYHGGEIEAAIWAFIGGEGIIKAGTRIIADITKEVAAAGGEVRRYIRVLPCGIKDDSCKNQRIMIKCSV
ncbi:MAG: hypothetical protein LBJ84_02150 [Oscillospiraceae bacterium]|nr:hypothetical protein [Oscillospiraceae bacterium]